LRRDDPRRERERRAPDGRYRLHLDPVNLFAVDTALSGRLGEVSRSCRPFGMAVKPDNIRAQHRTGGGTLWDIGIYCINAARYLFRDEPVEVFAWATDIGRPRFRDVEESTSCVLRFADGRLATFWTGFTSADIATYSLIGSKGHLRVDGAYEYHEPRQTTLTIDSKTIHRRHRMQDQFAAELVYFADCVRRHATPVPSGLEGRADVAIIRRCTPRRPAGDRCGCASPRRRGDRIRAWRCRSRRSGASRRSFARSGRTTRAQAAKEDAMARPFWKGSISFGLVEIGVTLRPARAAHGISFTLLDSHDYSPVGYKRYNKSTGKEVPWDRSCVATSTSRTST
jgi:hypothetical protein